MQKIIVKDVSKIYGENSNKVIANDAISFDINEGEFVVILGPSGAGKSTLLNIIGGMDNASKGSINIFGKEIVGLSEAELTRYRREDIGFVFQFYNLIPNLTVLENVELAGQIVKQPKKATEILKLVGLEHRMDNFPSQISGGEQQRVAIARAIAKNPKLLLCDEPTGALDYQTGKQVLKILQDMSRQKGATVIIVTHNSSLAPIADRVIHMRDATVMRVTINENPQAIDTLEY